MFLEAARPAVAPYQLYPSDRKSLSWVPGFLIHFLFLVPD
jgi:hypothetical protein